MATTHRITRAPAPRGVDSRGDARWMLAWGAPAAAILAGLAAEWLDFRALRYPLLAMAGAGVLATAWALFARVRPLRSFVSTVALGALTWGAAETLYVALHAGLGQSFDAERFGPQWAQALGLIGVHALFLGVPTGVVAGVLLRVMQPRRS
jgi:hypothetical protein